MQNYKILDEIEKKLELESLNPLGSMDENYSWMNTHITLGRS